MNFLPSHCSSFLKSLVSSAALLATLSSCSVTEPIEPEAIKTRPLNDYQLPWDLQVPEEFEVTESSTIFNIPDGPVSDVLFSRRTLPRAREIISSGLTGAVRLHRLGDRYWLAAEMPPSTLWPLLKNYWQSIGAATESENPAEGEMFSATIPDVSPPRHYRLKIEGGLRSGSSEAHLTPLNQAGAEISVPGAIEDRFRHMLLYLQSVDDIASSMLVQHLDFKTKLTTGTDNSSYPYIELQLDPRRAWSLLLSVIRKLELDVVGIDRGRRIIALNYHPQVTRIVQWQPKWEEQAWQPKLGLSPPQANADNLRSSSAGEKIAVRDRVNLRLGCEAGICRLQLDSQDLPVNSAFELISQLVQEIN